MSKNATLTLAGTGIVAVVFILWLITANKPASLAPLGAAPAATTNGKGAGAGGGSSRTFASILAERGSYECSYEQVGASLRSTNTLYISDGALRGEFRAIENGSGAATNTIMVYDGAYLYIWREGETAGTKTRISSIADLPQAIPADLTSGAIFGSAGENVSWDCHPWIRDASLLRAPSYVTFTAK